jgi:hypothetical protein
VVTGRPSFAPCALPLDDPTSMARVGAASCRLWLEEVEVLANLTLNTEKGGTTRVEKNKVNYFT